MIRWLRALDFEDSCKHFFKQSTWSGLIALHLDWSLSLVLVGIAKQLEQRRSYFSTEAANLRQLMALGVASVLKLEDLYNRRTEYL